MKSLTNKQVLQMECTHEDRNVRWTLNFSRLQFGSRVARRVATLISQGSSVTVVTHPNGEMRDGFLIDGEYTPWSEV